MCADRALLPSISHPVALPGAGCALPVAIFAFMIPPTTPELIARAAAHPFLSAHLVMGQGAHSDIALARFDGMHTRQRL